MKKLAVFLAAAVLSTSVLAAKPIKWGTGGPTGNYFSMTNDVVSYCADESDGSSVLDRPVEVLNTEGSVENVFGLINKKYAVAWVQEDVLQYYGKQNPTKVNQNSLRIVAGGHQETVHLLIPKGYQPESSGSAWSKITGAFSSDDGQAIDINLLKGQRIASKGGSIVSTKALSFFLDLGLRVEDMGDGGAGDLPVLLVGGQPYAPVEELLNSGNYTMVPLDGALINQKAPFYTPNTVNYESGGELISLPSVGVRAYIVAKALRKKSKNANMAQLANCIEESLEDLADDPDTNPNWTSVVDLEESGEQTNWKYFELD